MRRHFLAIHDSVSVSQWSGAGSFGRGPPADVGLPARGGACYSRPMLRRGGVRSALALVAVGVAGLLAGCAALGAPERPTSTSTPAAVVPDQEPTAQQLPNLLVAGETIGTGELQVVDHEPLPEAAADHPVTGAVRVVVGPDRGIEVHIRPDYPAATVDLTGLSLMLTGQRLDGHPANIQDEAYFGLDPWPKAADAGADSGGELVLTLPLDSPSAADPTFLHALEEFPDGDGRMVAAAEIDWTIPQSFPTLKAVDHGAEAYARGRAVVDQGTLAYYVPSPNDTVYQVSRRFGLTEAQLVWLNPELLMNAPQPQLTTGIGVNLDPARR
jgi:hypothetical protein